MDKVFNLLSFASTPSYTVTGTFSYYLDVVVKGDAPYQTSTLSITAYTKSNKKIAIATSCKWYRIYENRPYCLATIHSNTYQLSAEDIGSTLKVEVQSLEDDYSGTAVVTYGPIRLDPNVRNTLENILGAGGSKFSIHLVNEETGEVSNEQGSLALTNDYIRVTETPARGKERVVKFKYSYDNPKVELNYLDCTRLYFSFKGDEEEIEDIKKFTGSKKGPWKIGAKFISRTSRDLLLLALKCFATKAYLINSKIINEINFSDEGKLFQDSPKSPQKPGDWLLEVDSIKREMNLVLQRNAELTRDKEVLQGSIKRLEEELAGTIETYSQLIGELRSTDEFQTPGKDTSDGGQNFDKKRTEELETEIKRLRHRVSELEEETKFVSPKETAEKDRFSRRSQDDELQLIKRDFENLSKHKKEENTFSLEYEFKIQELEEQNLELKTKNKILSDEIKAIKSRFSDSPKLLKTKSSPGEDNLHFFENKLSETKKLNELLIREVNSQKSKNESLQREIDLLRAELNKLRETEEQTRELREKVSKAKIASLEEQIAQLKQAQYSRSPEYAKSARFDADKLQKENEELKSKLHQLERSQSVGVHDESIPEKYVSQVKAQFESLHQELAAVKAKNSSLEIELAKAKKESNPNMSSNDKGNLSSRPSYSEEIDNILNRSYNSIKRPEGSLDDILRENDRLYSEVITLKSKVTILDVQLQMAKTDDLYKKSLSYSYSTSDKSGAERELEQLRQAHEELKNKYNSAQNEIDKLRVELQTAKYGTLSDTARIENENLKRENDFLKSEIDSLRNGNEKLKEAEYKINELKSENELLTIEINSLKSKKDSLSKEVDYLRNEVSLLRKTTGSPLSSPTKNLDYKQSYDELLEKYERLQQEYKQLEILYENAKNSVGLDVNRNLLSEFEDVKQMNELLQKEILDYKERIEDLQRSRSGNNSTNEENERERLELKKENKSLYQQISEQRERIRELEIEVESLKYPKLNESSASDKVAGDAELLKEVERLRNENESLLQQRNQMSKKLESLSKELESKVSSKGNQAILDNLAKTNERLIQENAKLMEQMRQLNDEIDHLRNSSRFENSRFEGEGENQALRDRLRDVETELALVTAEKDKLLVELSRLMAQDKGKKNIF